MDRQTQQWRGYTLQELQVKRIINLTRIELEQAKLRGLTERFSSKSGLKLESPLLRKMFSALDYVDYAVLAYKFGHKIFSIFRHKK